MAVESIKPTNQIVKASNDLVRAKDDVNSPTASRVLAGLIAQVDNSAPQFNKEYSFPLSLLTDISTIGGSNRKRIRAAIDELSKCRVWLEDKGKISAIPFFTIITYADGMISGEFNAKIKPYLLGLNSCFTQFTLPEYFSLPSTYSQKMFKLLKSWEKGNKKGFVDIALTDLHDYLQTPVSLRNEYRNFKRLVLQKAEKDINSKTSIQFTWEPLKTGRAITAIRFKIKARRNRNASENVALPAVTVTQQTLLSSAKQKDAENAQYCAFSLRGECEKKTCVHRKMCETVFLPLARKGGHNDR